MATLFHSRKNASTIFEAVEATEVHVVPSSNDPSFQRLGAFRDFSMFVKWSPEGALDSMDVHG
jgi:hypothetical protein